jgi:glycerate kinase
LGDWTQALRRWGDALDQDAAERAGRPPISNVAGAGAAGGTAAALLWLFPQARLQPGIEIVLDAVRFDDHLRGASLVLTGEGRLDAQTLGGKVMLGVARRSNRAGVPCAALVGSLDPAATDSGALTQLRQEGLPPCCP